MKEEIRIGEWAVRYRVIRRLAGGEIEDLLQAAVKDMPTTVGEANTLKKVLESAYLNMNPGRTPALDIVAFLVHDNVDDGGGIELHMEMPDGEDGDD